VALLVKGEKFVVDYNNEEVKGDWVLPIIQKDMIYNKSIFQLKSKYVCEMMEGDLEIKVVSMMCVMLISLTEKTSLSIIKIVYRYIYIGSVQV